MRHPALPKLIDQHSGQIDGEREVVSCVDQERFRMTDPVEVRERTDRAPEIAQPLEIDAAVEPFAHMPGGKPSPDDIGKPRRHVVEHLRANARLVRRGQIGPDRNQGSSRECRCARIPGAPTRRSLAARRAPPGGILESSARCSSSRCSRRGSVPPACARHGKAGSFAEPTRRSEPARATGRCAPVGRNSTVAERPQRGHAVPVRRRAARPATETIWPRPCCSRRVA